MKILHVCLGERYVDGYGYQENILTKLHKQQGHEVFILASTLSLINKVPGFVQPSRYVNEYGIPVIRIPYVSWLPHKLAEKLRIYDGTYSAIEEIHPEVIFIHCATFVDIKKITKYLKTHLDVKVFVDSHTDYINSARNWLSMNIMHKVIYRWCYKQIEPFTIKFWGTLPIRCKFLEEIYHVPNNKIELLPMGIDLSDIKNLDREIVRKEMREKYGFGENDFIVVTGGKLEQRKNTIELIRAILSINNPHIKLFLFGNISENIAEDANELLAQNNDKIVYGGWVKSEEIYRYLLIGDLCVFPGTHSAIWEQAVGLGLPCIFKRWNNITHIDLDGNCLLIDDVSVNGITESIMSLYNDIKRLSSMKVCAENKGPKVFSYDEIAKKAIGKNYSI